jgi:hypothetical protein
MLKLYFQLQEQPPQCLLEFHPLADYCNGILSAFNELRLCAPIALAHTATNHLRESLGTVVRCTLAFYRQEQQALTQAEKDNFTRFCACFAGQLLPYIQKCLHALFPPAVIASHLGVTLQLLQTEVQICVLYRFITVFKFNVYVFQKKKYGKKKRSLILIFTFMPFLDKEALFNFANLLKNLSSLLCHNFWI